MITTFIGTYEDLVEISGTSQKGAFTYWQLVLKHDSHPQYGDKLVAVSIWKSELLQTVNQLAQGGQQIQIDCEVNAKPFEAEGKKKYAVDIRCFRVSPVTIQQPRQQPMMQYAVQQPPQQMNYAVQQPMTQPQQPMQMPSQQPYGFTAPAMPNGQGTYGGNGNNNPPF